jgi:hypothetical protein
MYEHRQTALIDFPGGGIRLAAMIQDHREMVRAFNLATGGHRRIFVPIVSPYGPCLTRATDAVDRQLFRAATLATQLVIAGHRIGTEIVLVDAGTTIPAGGFAYRVFQPQPTVAAVHLEITRRPAISAAARQRPSGAAAAAVTAIPVEILFRGGLPDFESWAKRSVGTRLALVQGPEA